MAREEETEELADLVAIYRGVLLYGASGHGKSSLINAGLLPTTAHRRLHPERVRVQPRHDEEIVIERIATTEDDDEHLPSLLTSGEDDSPRVVLSASTFEARLREACASHRPLLIFDQFEEIVTLFEEESAVALQRAVVEMLVRLLREPLPVKLLLVFREDYLGQIKHLLAAVPELVDQALRLEPLSTDALPTIIRGPFERHPGHFERELDADLSKRVCAALAQRFGSSGVSLSEVETVALRLWLSNDPQVVLETRGVQGLLEDYLGESLNAFSPELRVAAVALLAQMVTAAGTRNVISAEDLVQRVRAENADLSPPLVSEALERLESESRLISRERRRDIYLYEITSEFLTPWISQRREEARLAEEYHRDGLRREELRREQARARRLLMLALLAGTLFVVAAIVAIVAVNAQSQRAVAERNTSEAQHQRAAAERNAADASRQRAAAERNASEAQRLRAAAERSASEAQRQRASARRDAAEAKRQRASAERQQLEAERQRASAKQSAALTAELARFDPQVRIRSGKFRDRPRNTVTVVLGVKAQRGVRTRVGCTGCPQRPVMARDSTGRLIRVIVPSFFARKAKLRVLFTDRNIGELVVLRFRGLRRPSQTEIKCRPRGSRLAASKVPARCPEMV